MTSISRYMRADRRYCDGLLDLIEPLGRSGRWGEVQQALLAFRCALEQHLKREERVLLPAIEEAYGSSEALLAMCRENDNVRGLLTAADAASSRHDAQALSAVLSKLRVVMEQHNLHEESVLYPLADALLADRAGDLLQALEGRPSIMPVR